MKKKTIVVFLPLFLLFSCVKTPQPVDIADTQYSKPSALVLCEGLYGYNNATITRYDISTNNTDLDYVRHNNPLSQLGDIANDALLKGDSLFVLVSTSKTLFLINLNTGKIINYANFEGFRYPRHIAIANDSILYFSDAYDNSINEFNINQWKITNKFFVGPQPEGLFFYQNKIYVVNSGWGDINKSHPDAGTLWIINTITNSIEKKIKVGPNPVEIVLDSTNDRYFVTYYNFPSVPDSLGGIIEYCLQNDRELMHWRGNFTNVIINNSNNYLFAIYNSSPKIQNNINGGIMRLDINENSMNLIIRNTLPNNIWYALAYDEQRQFLWIGNAKNFQVNGEILIYDINNPFEPFKSFETGMNPNRILFYN